MFLRTNAILAIKSYTKFAFFYRLRIHLKRHKKNVQKDQQWTWQGSISGRLFLFTVIWIKGQRILILLIWSKKPSRARLYPDVSHGTPRPRKLWVRRPSKFEGENLAWKHQNINRIIRVGAFVSKKKKKTEAKNGNRQGVNPLGRQNGRDVLLYPQMFKVLTPCSVLHTEKVNLSPFTRSVQRSRSRLKQLGHSHKLWGPS